MELVHAYNYRKYSSVKVEPGSQTVNCDGCLQQTCLYYGQNNKSRTQIYETSFHFYSFSFRGLIPLSELFRIFHSSKDGAHGNLGRNRKRN